MESKVDKKVRDYKEMPLVKRVLKKLRAELPEDLKYHSLAHTEDVMHEVITFGIEDGLSEKDLDLLVIAAVFHDYGFLVRYSDNEIYGADFAALAMEQSGSYSKEEIELVSQMILDTALIVTEEGAKSVASSKLAGYLLDADLSNFGRADFFDKLDLISQERNISCEVLYPGTLKLLLNHQWNTQAAKKLRGEQKQLNQKRLQDCIDATASTDSSI